MEYQIGDFSRISRLSIKTLRYYHECGILTPSSINEQSGYRSYNEASLERARVIEELRTLEFSIKEIKEILDNCTDDSEIIAYMNRKSGEIGQKIAKYEEVQQRIDIFLKNEEELKMKKVSDKVPEVAVKKVDDLLIASLRYKGRYNEIGKAFGSLMRSCGRYYNGVPFALYYDPEFKEVDADIEACVPVKKEVNTGEIKSRTLKGGRAVTAIHYGPYETIGDTYKAVIDYMNKNQLKSRIPSREIYLKGPGMIFPRSPKKFVTEIQMFVE